RGAVIIARSELMDNINRAVFPTLQGGPHNNQILAKAIAFTQALEPAYHKEQKQVVANARVLAEELKKLGYTLYTGGTENHLMLLDLSKNNLDASWAEKQLETVGILANRNSLPHDDKPFKPSGLRLGTPSATARGLKEKEMKKIAALIHRALQNKEDSGKIKKEVKNLANKFIFNT
ncbi:MAG: serine hydroxymethyltransferase, partial [Candidatus Sungbacteria bacterium]|nr:serine hydroxymethyltransferase [Candidatus Sungbacteria bacterium]